MEILKALELEIYDHFRPKMVNGEEVSCLCAHAIVVEFSVPWFGFMFRSIIYVRDGYFAMYLVDNDLTTTLYYQQEITDPLAIDNLLIKLGEEWNRYLNRSKSS